MVNLGTAIATPLMLLIFAAFCLVMGIALVHLARAHATVNQLREQIIAQHEEHRPRPRAQTPPAEQRIGTDEDLEAAIYASRARTNGHASENAEATTFNENANVSDEAADEAPYYHGR